jgi:hypothetical protein
MRIHPSQSIPGRRRVPPSRRTLGTGRKCTTWQSRRTTAGSLAAGGISLFITGTCPRDRCCQTLKPSIPTLIPKPQTPNPKSQTLNPHSAPKPSIPTLLNARHQKDECPYHVCNTRLIRIYSLVQIIRKMRGHDLRVNAVVFAGEESSLVVSGGNQSPKLTVDHRPSIVLAR